MSAIRRNIEGPDSELLDALSAGVKELSESFASVVVGAVEVSFECRRYGCHAVAGLLT